MGPFLAKHIGQIEMVQRRAVRFISNWRGRDGVTAEREAIVWSFWKIEERMQGSNFHLKYCRVILTPLLQIISITSQLGKLFSIAMWPGLWHHLVNKQLLNKCILTAFYLKPQEIWGSWLMFTLFVCYVLIGVYIFLDVLIISVYSYSEGFFIPFIRGF